MQIWGPYLVSVVGLLMLVGGIFGPEDAAVGTATVALGGVLSAFGPPLLARLKGPVEVGPGGVKGDIQPIQLTAQAPSEARARVLAETNAEIVATASADPPAGDHRQLTMVELIADAMAAGWAASHTFGCSR